MGRGFLVSVLAVGQVSCNRARILGHLCTVSHIVVSMWLWLHGGASLLYSILHFPQGEANVLAEYDREPSRGGIGLTKMAGMENLSQENLVEKATENGVSWGRRRGGGREGGRDL